MFNSPRFVIVNLPRSMSKDKPILILFNEKVFFSHWFYDIYTEIFIQNTVNSSNLFIQNFGSLLNFSHYHNNDWLYCSFGIEQKPN